jgi:hypothetical protein
LIVGAIVPSVAASDRSDEVGDEASQAPNEISVWYQTPFGKFNVVPIPPIRESTQRDQADSEQSVWLYDRPHPFSSFRNAIVVERDADFTISLLDSAGFVVSSLTYVGVEPGWYALMYGTTGEVESIRIESSKLVIGEWSENH